MTERVVEQAERTKSKHQIVLYHICSMELRWANLYAMGGETPNARFIAHQYGCELQFRESRCRPTKENSFSPSFLRKYGISEDGSCLSAILVGDDEERLAEAKAEIQRTHGLKSVHEAYISIGRDVSFN